MTPIVKAHIALFFATLIYAGNYTIAKEVMPTYILPEGIIFMRVLSGMILFWLFASFKPEKIDRKDFPRLAMCGLFGVAINQMFFFKGLNLTTPINASLILLTTPILVLIISAILIRERVTALKILGILIGVIGAVFLVAKGRTVAFSSEGLVGDLLVLVNSISYGIYLVIVKPLMKKYEVMTVVKWAFLFGFIYILPFSIQEFSITNWAAIPIGIWAAVLYILIGVTFLTYLFNAIALKILTPSIVSIYIYAQPVLATLIAISFGKDALSIEKVIASLLIFSGVFLVSQGDNLVGKLKSVP